MTEKGIKVKELARELGVTSRRLIEWCREHGLPVQNSITRVPPRDADRVRHGWSTEAPPDRQRDDG